MAINQFTTAVSLADYRLNHALDLLLINVGNRCFGLPLAEVRYVSSLPPGFAGYGPETERHFIFQDNPVPFVSLWNQLDLKSEYVEYEEIQVLLPARRQDHLDWMGALEDAIRNGTTFSKARNPRECAFGKWYYNYRPQNMGLSLMMHNFEKPHTQIHHLADKLLSLVEKGQVNDALRIFQESKNTTLAELLNLFDLTQKLISDLQRRIAVIVVDGDNYCALGADGVRDIVAVPAEQIKPDLRRSSQATSALAILEDQTVAPLINWRTLFAEGENKISYGLNRGIHRSHASHWNASDTFLHRQS